ncbi:MAG TPA: anti-sigma regulatory factor [Polyangia bacterium]|nr:anti-sigma regulatory factor [Polyangia bacterium]
MKSGTLDVRARVDVRDDSDLVVARRLVRQLGAAEKLSTAAIEALATAVTELGRNIVVHAGSGTLLFGTATDGVRRGVSVIARDAGPGIDDVARAMRDGYSSGDGLGLGLPSARRLVDEFEIASTLGAGTTVTVTKWRA